MLLLLLLWTVALSAGVKAQSGGADTDMVPTVSCTSHISMYEGTSISCQLISNDLDDDEDEDAIERITACWFNIRKNNESCVVVMGETLSSAALNPIPPVTLKVLSKKGHRIETRLQLTEIIKPKCPHVHNVTLNQNQALVHVQIPYHKDYLKEDNLYLQLQLWSEKTNQIQNMTSSPMIIGRNHLRNGTEYHVKVRALPSEPFKGTWSEWSQPYTFHTPPGESSGDLSFMMWGSIIPVVAVLVVLLSVAFMRKNKLLTYMWPNIPHPKTTLGQICGPNNGLLLFYIPEEFSSLNVYTSLSQSAGPSCSEKEPALSSPGTNEPASCSTQSTDASMSASSVRTEELELLSQSSTSEEEQDDACDDQPTESTAPLLESTETPPTEHNSTQQERDNSYVTMSSFYEIKTAATADRTAPINLIVT